MKQINPIEMEVFKNRFASICDEMGVSLCRSSFSTNIKERRDYSCALFDAQARLVAQAAHIPVHLGSMSLSVMAALKGFPKLNPSDAVLLNDPYRGGTHLPDITLIEPVFLPGSKRPNFFIANRAHHSDVGGHSPGSMPITRDVHQEGVVIPPTLFKKRGRLNQPWLKQFLKKVRTPVERKADLMAQLSANRIGKIRLLEMIQSYGRSKTNQAMKAYREYQSRITQKAIRQIPPGQYYFEDFLDSDGLGSGPIPIRVHLKISKQGATIDFRDSHPQVPGPLNAPYAVTLSATAYVFRCLVLALTGEDCLSTEPLRLKTTPGSVVDARYPAPVAGGNVETSQRIVDVLFGALSQALPQLIPAASQGTMNNLAMGGKGFTYYETMAGGMGAGPKGKGEDAMHSHMTNTLNTPIEALEHDLPLKLTRYQIRPKSGGRGKNQGGKGLIREYQFLLPTRLTLLTERRDLAPYGLQGGRSGTKGKNLLKQKNKTTLLPGKAEISVQPGDRLAILTPGGGAWGSKP